MSRPLIVSSFCLFFFLTQLSAIEIYLNQVGYYPKSKKIALIEETRESTFSVLEEGFTVYRGRLSRAEHWEEAGQKYSLADFSELKDEGTYTLKIGNQQTPPFTISNRAYLDVARATVKALYFQRASAELEKKHAGEWARPFGHPDTDCEYHPSSGRSGGSRSSPGGWYDAGDYGKYTVPLAYTAYRLLSLYERYPFVFGDGSLNIPESGNGQNDLLDEIRVGLDWLHTMQDDDGSVFHKLTTLTFARKDILPHQASRQRFIIGKSTKAALDFAGALASAARIFREIDPDFSQASLNRAERAWKWAQENPEVRYRNPEDVKTGDYKDPAGRDEFFWAAVELYISTKDRQYLSVIEGYESSPRIHDTASWTSGKMHGVFSMLKNQDAFPDRTIKRLERDYLAYAEQIAQQIENSPGRIVSSRFGWGSNGYKSFRGVALMEAFRLSGDSRYFLAAGEVADYLLGKNATGYSFITGFGSKQLTSIHHRLSLADDVDDLIPGLLSGGPNKGQEDKRGVDYPSNYPAKSFIDDARSYASNEITTYWNAEASYLLSALEIEHRNL